jgi:hypothetical protein
MESKLLIGGRNIMDHTNEQQKMLELKRQEIAEQVGLPGFRSSWGAWLKVMSGGWSGALRLLWLWDPGHYSAEDLRCAIWVPWVYQPRVLPLARALCAGA